MKLRRLGCAAALLALFVSAAAAQTYPVRQITLVVPFAPGGPADFLGRLIGQKMSEDLGSKSSSTIGPEPTPSSVPRQSRRQRRTATRC